MALPDSTDRVVKFYTHKSAQHGREKIMHLSLRYGGTVTRRVHILLLLREQGAREFAAR